MFLLISFIGDLTMPPRKKRTKKEKPARSSCICGDNCHENHSHLPGLLLMGIGLIALPLNFGIVSGFEWARAWPLVIVLIGAVLVAKVGICRGRS